MTLNKWIHIVILIISTNMISAQTITSRAIKENRWVVNSNLNLPAIKFLTMENNKKNNANGTVEFFNSFGVGLGINYGKAIFQFDTVNKIPIYDKTEFSNLIGFQLGFLYSSSANNSGGINQNQFAIFGGINILDVQFGYGYELGQRPDSFTGHFFSISYGIPLHKIRSKSSYMLKNYNTQQDTIDNCMNSIYHINKAHLF